MESLHFEDVDQQVPHFSPQVKISLGFQYT